MLEDEDGDTIGVDGTLRWCTDLGVDPEDVSLLAIAYELKSPTVGEWTKSGFVDGWQRLGYVTHFPTCIYRTFSTHDCLTGWMSRCDNIPAMKTTIEQLRTKLSQDPAYFSQVYTFTFNFAKVDNARSICAPFPYLSTFPSLLSIRHIAVENAIAFWTLLLNTGLEGSALPRNGWKDEYTQWWFDFLGEKGGKGVSKDTWAMVRPPSPVPCVGLVLADERMAWAAA